MSLQYLKQALAGNDTEKLIRYVRLHLGDGNEAAGRKEIEKAWVEALKPLLDSPSTDRDFIFRALAEKDAATLAHLFFHFIPLARLQKPLSQARLTFVSSAGVQPKKTLPFDVVHLVGDYSFRHYVGAARGFGYRSRSELRVSDLKLCLISNCARVLVVR